MKNTLQRKEAGFSLITAVVIITLLVFLGAMVLNQVEADVQLAGGDRAAANAMYIAEAGAVWGKQQLVNILYGTNTSGPPTVSAITSLTPLGSADSLCPDGVNCAQYYLLSPTQTVPYNNGTYHVGVTCLPYPCSGVPSSYIIRSLGKTPDGASRLIEVSVGY